MLQYACVSTKTIKKKRSYNTCTVGLPIAQPRVPDRVPKHSDLTATVDPRLCISILFCIESGGYSF